MKIRIKGFSRYTIDMEKKTFESLSKRHRKDAFTHRSVVLYADDGQRYETTYPRCLYAALRGIDPRDISSKFVIKLREDGTFQIRNHIDVCKDGMLKYFAGLRHTEQPPYIRYRLASQNLGVIADALERDDKAYLLNLIDSYKENCRCRVVPRFGIRKDSTFDEYWSIMQINLIDSIENGNTPLLTETCVYKALSNTIMNHKKKEIGNKCALMEKKL